MQMNSADKDGCSEVIMHRDNILTEGGASNIFLVLDDVIKTPSLDQNHFARHYKRSSNSYNC